MSHGKRSPVDHPPQGSEGRDDFVRRWAISCAVRNLSDGGASLEVASPVGIPESIVLELDGSGRRCRVIWRKDKRIGVRFLDFKDKPKTAF